MNTQNYINCLSSLNSNTGLIRGSYNFSNQVGSVILNDLYPTGETYFQSGAENIFYAEKYNLSLFSGANVYSGQFTGELRNGLSLRMDNFESSSDFDVLIDFSIDDCSKAVSTVLFSSTSGDSTHSGIVFGYNARNKWFVEYGSGEFNRIKTFRTSELNKNNLISFGILNGAFYFKKYDTINNLVEYNQENLLNFNNSNKFIFGKSFGAYSGFSGSVNHIFISRNASFIDDLNRFECAFCSGIDTGIDTVVVSGEVYNDPLSFGMLDISGSGITGYETSVYYNSDLGIYQASQTGLTGYVFLDSILTGNSEVQSGVVEQEFSIPLIDAQKKKSYNNDSISINFISNVESGDLLEIYDYNEKNNNINLPSGQAFSSDIAVFSNGMLLISGLDYSISQNGFIQYDSDSSDEIRVNKLSSPIKYLIYSGLYENYRQITGSGSYTGFYPNSSQFLESGDGNVTITGFASIFGSGFALSGYDLFMNGQKIYSGIDYFTGQYGGSESLIIYANNFNDAKLQITTGVSGELVSIDESTESILAFSPVQGQIYSKVIDFRSGNAIIYPLSGKSAEIWLNGIKMIEYIDYSIKYPCKHYVRNFNYRDLPYVF